jgi:hypothetical protein
MGRVKYTNKDNKALQGITTLKSQQLGWGKQPLMIWANKQGLEGKTLNEARDTTTIPGTIAHLLIESHLKQFPTDVNGYPKSALHDGTVAYHNFLQWSEQFKFKPIAVEPHLVSEKYQLGGTPDVIAEVMGKLCVVDWKTGRTYEDLFLQLAFYKIVWEENNPDLPITGGFHVLRIPKNEDIPSFHHSHWANLPKEAEMAINAALILRVCEKVLKALL